jgi:hypothetical protein
MFNIQLPAGVWQFVFPAGRTLPHLTMLYVSEGTYYDPKLPGWWGADDLASLASCCPNLRMVSELSLRDEYQHFSELQMLTVLQPLAGLTQLQLAYGSWLLSDFQLSLQGLAVVTQLQQLLIKAVLDHVSSACSVTSLLALTNLTALTYLSCSLVGDDDRDGWTDIDKVKKPPCGVHLNQVSPLPGVVSRVNRDKQAD